MTDTDRDETLTCGFCDAPIPLDDAISTDDAGYICPACHGRWKEGFDHCAHTWEPHIDEMGDPGFYCGRCFGFVATESFAALGLPLPETAK